MSSANVESVYGVVRRRRRAGGRGPEGGGRVATALAIGAVDETRLDQADANLASGLRHSVRVTSMLGSQGFFAQEVRERLHLCATRSPHQLYFQPAESGEHATTAVGQFGASARASATQGSHERLGPTAIH